MASRYAFSSGLKELRFLFCQTSEQSAPVRCVFWILSIYQQLMNPAGQTIPYEKLPGDEEAQPACANYDTGSGGH
jgi:hypothetical protein